MTGVAVIHHSAFASFFFGEGFKLTGENPTDMAARHSITSADRLTLASGVHIVIIVVSRPVRRYTAPPSRRGRFVSVVIVDFFSPQSQKEIESAGCCCCCCPATGSSEEGSFHYFGVKVLLNS